MSAINEFLLANDLRISRNPCISPDYCLDWPALAATLKSGAGLITYPRSRFDTAAGSWTIVENATGDHAWILESAAGSSVGGGGLELTGGHTAFPATWEFLLLMKNRIQAHDPSNAFPMFRILPNRNVNPIFVKHGRGDHFTRPVCIKFSGKQVALGHRG